MKRYQIIVALNLSLIIVFMITGSYFCAFIFRFSGCIGYSFLHRKNNDDLSFIDDTFSKPLSHTNSCFHNFQENMNFQEAQGLCKSKGMELPSSDAKSEKFISILDQLRKCLYIPETYFDTMFCMDAMIFRNGSYFGDETLKNQTKADFKKKKIKVAFHIFLDESKSKINLEIYE